MSEFRLPAWRHRPARETFPPDTDRRIYADEDKEGSALQAIQDGLIPDVRSDPALGPACCNKVQQRIGREKGSFLGTFPSIEVVKFRHGGLSG